MTLALFSNPSLDLDCYELMILNHINRINDGFEGDFYAVYINLIALKVMRNWFKPHSSKNWSEGHVWYSVTLTYFKATETELA